MKIGILCYPTSGGSGVIAAELGMALAERGHEIHLFSYRPPFRLRPMSERFHCHEITIPQYTLFEYPSYGMAAACKIAEVDLDLLHCHYAYPHAVSAFLAKEMSNRKLRTVTTLHGTDIMLVGQDVSFARATKFGLERSDAVTAVSKFRFVGEDPDVADHLKGAGLLLSTSEFEGFGMSVLEAMSCGVPVVTTDSGGTAEVVSESCARVAAVGDVEGLAAAAVEILRDPNLSRTMGEAGRRRAEEMFDVDRVVPQYEALYERVCGASNAENLSV
ncbi:MAG: glycosyltransferase [Planctomycetes bacterium]|nr:glycosyltransferase [Planctomycetota bacterium]